MTTDTLLEKQFLLGNVMQVAVLNHAEAFREGSIEQYFNLLRRVESFAEENLKSLHSQGDLSGYDGGKAQATFSEVHRAAWQKLAEQNLQNLFRNLSPDGSAIPESLAVALQEIILAAEPSLGRILGTTQVVGSLIDRFGVNAALRTYVDALFACDMSGAIAIFEPGDTHHMEVPNTLATMEEDGSCLVSGIKERIVAGGRGIAENIVYLVTARADAGVAGAEKTLLVAVPRYLDVDGQHVENGISVDEEQPIMGLRVGGSCKISFGGKSPCRGFPLEIPEGDIDSVQERLNDWHNLNVLQAVAQTGAAILDLQRYCKDPGPETVRLKDAASARLTPAAMFLKSVNEGLRGAFYMGAFYKDCEQHGAAEQKTYFSDLATFYREMLTIYAPGRALEAVSNALRQGAGQAFDPENNMELHSRDLQTSLLFGPDENKAAEVILYQLFPRDNGRILQQLLKQFESVESHQVMSEHLNEAIGIWRDYIGGVIVLFDDIMAGLQDSQSLISPMFAMPIVRLFGDVIVCYHLIAQGVEAERTMAEGEVNFYNLQQEVSSNPELYVWYSKLLQAEYFAVHVLSLQESIIRLIQRNPQALLEPV